MKKLLAMLLGIALGAGLLSAASALEPLAEPAAAATSYVSKTYTAPKKGQTNAGVKALQRRLVKAGTLEGRYVTSYFGSLTETAVKKFQRTHGLTANGRVSKATWNVLVAKTGTIKIVTTSVKLPKRCTTGARVLCIDKTKRKLYYVKSGKVAKTMDARFGCAGMRTREGTFQVNWKSRNHVSTLFHTAMPYSMFFSGGQAVHYSADFAARGYAGCSHGCVNIRNKDGLRWVFDQMRTGDRVVVYRS